MALERENRVQVQIRSVTAAKAGLEAFIFMPRDTPKANIIECIQAGVHLTLIDGLITDCSRIVGDRKQAEGIFAAPEGGACLPALKQLIVRGEVSRDERIVLFNTGSGLKYLDAFA